MDNTGYRWTVSPEASGDWRWAITGRDTGQTILSGVAVSRAVAAAYIVRAIATGMTVEAERSLAA